MKSKNDDNVKKRINIQFFLVLLFLLTSLKQSIIKKDPASVKKHSPYHQIKKSIHVDKRKQKRLKRLNNIHPLISLHSFQSKSQLRKMSKNNKKTSEERYLKHK